MPLATISEPPHDSEGLATWAFSHMAHHRDIIRVIRERFAIVLPEFCLDPLDPKDPSLWVFQHQVMHQQMDAVLGIAPFNLSLVDWSNLQSLEPWIAANSIEHDQAGLILQLG